MKRLGPLLLVALLAGCGTFEPGDGPPRSDRDVTPSTRVPGPEPRSRYGNPRFYEVAGQRYYVSDTADNYRERGVASWYGRKFHGRRTSSGEVYDMHAMTAAHKSLPLPTWVRVTHLGNGRSIVVRVNDRGPFVDNRIIDLSYAAATALDMVDAGTALVEVEALEFDAPEPAATAPTTAAAPGEPLYMQVGAFAERGNAERRLRQLSEAGVDDAFVAQAETSSGSVYRVRVGPIGDVASFDRISSLLADIGIRDIRLVDAATVSAQ